VQHKGRQRCPGQPCEIRRAKDSTAESVGGRCRSHPSPARIGPIGAWPDYVCDQGSAVPQGRAPQRKGRGCRVQNVKVMTSNDSCGCPAAKILSWKACRSQPVPVMRGVSSYTVTSLLSVLDLSPGLGFAMWPAAVQ